MGVARLVRTGLSRLGYELNRSTPMWHWRLRLPAMLEHRAIRLVLDVGASDGGFAFDLLDGGYGGRIISFEPLPDAWEALRNRAARYGDRWIVAPRMALSDTTGNVAFHEAGNSKSSSLLVMTERHTDAAPHTATIREHVVPTRTLDDVLAEFGVRVPCYLKIDVQGAEHLVLAGAKAALADRIAGLQMEMSLVGLYEGQDSSADLHALVTRHGYELWDMIPGFRDGQTYRLLQYDGVYFKVGPASR